MQLLVFSLVALAMVAGGMAHNVFKQNQATAQVQQRTTAAHLLEQARAVLASESFDVDGDGFPESPAMAASASAPAGGGAIPLTSGAPKTDAWSSAIGYCAFNHGSQNAGGAGRIAGDNPAGQQAVVFAIISAGPDKVFQTSCAQAAAGERHGDDGVRTITVAQLRQGVGGTQYFGDPVTDEAALAALNPAALKDGEFRVVKSTGEARMWKAETGEWALVAGAGGGTSGATFPPAPGYDPAPPPFLTASQPNIFSNTPAFTMLKASNGALYAAGANLDNIWAEPGGDPAQTLTWRALTSMPADVEEILHTPWHDTAVIKKTDGSYWAIGNNAFGRYGTGNSTRLSDWTEIIPASVNPVKVVVQLYRTLYLTEDGRLFVAGSGPDNSTTNYSTFTQLRSDVMSFAVTAHRGGAYDCWAVVTQSGQLYSRGNAPGCGTGTGNSAGFWTLQMDQVSGVAIRMEIVQASGSNTSALIFALAADGALMSKRVGSSASSSFATSAVPPVSYVASGEGVSTCPTVFSPDGSAWIYVAGSAAGVPPPVGAYTAEAVGNWRRLSISDVVAIYPSSIIAAVVHTTGGGNQAYCHSLVAVKADGSVWAIGEQRYATSTTASSGTTVSGKFGINSTQASYTDWTRVL